ncbi:nuclear transport factor 2 family protein [Streptomyces sp. NPDC046977]|uniref:nuclear transport factor 2 family protein n=1 Tax=Streptomyces sp. NPDC046977 TaxID=3154703 RepID=UPI0033C75659
MTDNLRILLDRQAIADALYRYTAGLDQGDTDLLTSALTEDAKVDLSAATSKIGFEIPALSPREVVVTALAAAVGPLDTTHAVHNLRIFLDGDSATAHCYIQAQHYLSGDGPLPERTRHALLMNNCTAKLDRDGDQWRISHLAIDLVWFEGDPTVLLPAS